MPGSIYRKRLLPKSKCSVEQLQRTIDETRHLLTGAAGLAQDTHSLHHTEQQAGGDGGIDPRGSAAIILSLLNELDETPFMLASTAPTRFAIRDRSFGRWAAKAGRRRLSSASPEMAVGAAALADEGGRCGRWLDRYRDDGEMPRPAGRR
jgi:hypothetical protein